MRWTKKLSARRRPYRGNEPPHGRARRRNPAGPARAAYSRHSDRARHLVTPWERRTVFQHRYRAHQQRIVALTEYFQFADVALVLRDLRRLPPKVLSAAERDILDGLPSALERHIAEATARQAVQEAAWHAAKRRIHGNEAGDAARRRAGGACRSAHRVRRAPERFSGQTGHLAGHCRARPWRVHPQGGAVCCAHGLGRADGRLRRDAKNARKGRSLRANHLCWCARVGSGRLRCASPTAWSIFQPEECECSRGAEPGPPGAMAVIPSTA